MARAALQVHETSDNCGGGATGDATYLLRAILQRGPFQRGEAAFGFIVDPEVVVQATDAGVGATLCDPMATPSRRHASHPCLMRWCLLRHATLTTVSSHFQARAVPGRPSRSAASWIPPACTASRWSSVTSPCSG